MSSISDYLQQIKTAVYGEEVRDAIYDAINQCYHDASAGITPIITTEDISTGTKVTIKVGANTQYFVIENGTATNEQVETYVAAWLDDHPDATTTVEDGSITVEKLDSDVLELIEDNSISGNVVTALLNCFQHVSWSDAGGQTAYNQLLSALAGDSHIVTYNLTHMTSSNNDIFVPDGESYTATFTADTGFEIDSITVTHGGVSVPVVSNSVTIASVTGDIVITAVASSESGLEPIHVWDLTSGLIDSVGSQTAVLNGNASRDSSGLTISSASDYAEFPDVWGKDRVIEVDVVSLVKGSSSNTHSRILTYKPRTEYNAGFIWHNSGYWAFYAGSWTDFSESDTTYLDGKTVKLVIDASKSVSVYVGGVLLGTATGGFSDGDTLAFGSSANSGYTCKITGVRVYDGGTS